MAFFSRGVFSDESILNIVYVFMTPESSGEAIGWSDGGGAMGLRKIPPFVDGPVRRRREMPGRSGGARVFDGNGKSITFERKKRCASISNCSIRSCGREP